MDRAARDESSPEDDFHYSSYISKATQHNTRNTAKGEEGFIQSVIMHRGNHAIEFSWEIVGSGDCSRIKCTLDGAEQEYLHCDHCHIGVQLNMLEIQPLGHF